jgi:hypothetical protein
MYVYTNGETELDHMADPRNIIDRLPRYKNVFDELDDLRSRTDELGTPTTQGTRKGYWNANPSNGLKVVARIPENQLIAFLAIEPDFLEPVNLRKFLRKHPRYGAYTNVKV